MHIVMPKLMDALCPKASNTGGVVHAIATALVACGQRKKERERERGGVGVGGDVLATPCHLKRNEIHDMRYCTACATARARLLHVPFWVWGTAICTNFVCRVGIQF